MSLTLILPALVFLWLTWKLLKTAFAHDPLNVLSGPPRSSVITGNLTQILHRRHGWTFLEAIGEQYGRVCRLNGLLGAKYLYVSDPKALQAMLLRGRYTFDHPDWMFARNEFIFGPGLFSLKDDRHRKQRKLLNAAFAPNNLRQITPIFYDVARRLCEALCTEVGESTEKLDMLEWSSRATLETMGTAAFGTSFDPIVRRVHSTIAAALKIFVPTLISADPWMSPLLLPGVMSTLGRKWARRLTSFYPVSSVRRMSSIIKTLDDTAEELLFSKIIAHDGQGDPASKQSEVMTDDSKDILTLLVEQAADPASSERLTRDELIAQLGTLLFAGADTTSVALGCVLQLLSGHQDVQTCLRNEIIAARNGQDLSYDQLMELPFLDAVCRETLRLHSPTPISIRQAREDVVLPLSQPIRGRDGTLIETVPVPRGTTVVIGLSACNCDKAIWGKDASEWKPDRWMSALPESVVKAEVPGIYSNLMTFMAGGRSCIGFNFSQLEMKVVLSVLLDSFEFHPADEKIYWNFAPIFYPSTDPAGDHAALPLLVKRYIP